MAATDMAAPAGPKSVEPFTPYQKLVVGILAFLQFTIILDFMILSPLGAVLMPALDVTTSQFGLVVSAYAFAAGISGVLAGGFADRFDRKKILLFFYVGFLVGTLLCAFANSFEALLIARTVTGLFGGVIGSIVFAITTDLFPMSMRGRVMGVVQTAFAGSQVLGIPIGLYLSAHWGWHMPFFMIVGVSSLAGILIFIKLKPIDAHLSLPRPDKAFAHLAHTLQRGRYIQGFATTALLATGGFMLMPFSSAFTVKNLGIHIEDLPMIYMITGISSIIVGPLMGRAADRFGKFNLFAVGSAITITMVTIYTNLGVTPFAAVVLVNVVMFIGISSRMIASQALMSAVPAPADRGAYMAVSSSLQQMSGGLASVIAGHVVSEGPGGVLEHFPTLGYIVCGATLITVVMMFQIRKMVPETPAMAKAA